MNDMQNVNFIPSFRLKARRSRRRLRIWIVGGIAYAATLLYAYILCVGFWSSDNDALAGEIAKADTRLEVNALRVAAVGRELGSVESVAHAEQSINNQPDWSKLLLLLSRIVGDEIVLRHCALETVQDTNNPRAACNEYQLKLTGFGITLADVSQFVLRLEQTGLFSQVKLVKTSREPFLADSAIAFIVDCSITGREE